MAKQSSYTLVDAASTDAWAVARAGTTKKLTVDKINTYVFDQLGLVSGQAVPFSDDGSGVLTLQNIDALDATTIATMEEALELNFDTFHNEVTFLAGMVVDDDQFIKFGANGEIRVGYDAAGDNRLEWTDGANLLMSLTDAGTAGNLAVTGTLDVIGAITTASVTSGGLVVTADTSLQDVTNVNSIQFDLTPAGGVAEGKMIWNTDDGTLNLGMPGGNVNLQIGQEQIIRVRNTTGSTIANGTPVYFSGASGNKPLITKADASAFATSLVAGVTTEAIENNSNGYATLLGLVRDVDTSGMTAGDLIWLSTTAGEFTNIRPTAPDMQVNVGQVVVAHATEGVIVAQITVVPRLVGLSDTFNETPFDDEIYQYNSSNSRFELIDSPTFAALTVTGDLTAGSISDPGIIGGGTPAAATFTDLTATGTVDLGITGVDGPLTITQNSDTLVLSHDGTDAYFKTSGGWFIFQTDEGTNTATNMALKPKGSSVETDLYFYDNTTWRLLFATTSAYTGVNVNGVDLSLNYDASNDITMFENAASGETKELKIYGYRAADALRSLEIGVGVDAADTASFDGVSNYLFDGTIKGTILNTGIVETQDPSTHAKPGVSIGYDFTTETGWIQTIRNNTSEARVLQLNPIAGNITLFSDSAAGSTPELQIYGYRAADALRSLEIGVGVDAANTASFDGVSNYLFDGALRTNGDISLGASGTIISQLDGTNAQLDINPYQMLRVGRLTNNASFSVDILKGDGTSTVNHRLNGTGDTYFAVDNGNVGIGTASPDGILHLLGNDMYQDRNSDDAFATTRHFRKSRGSAGSETIVSEGDLLGQIRAWGHDGAGYELAAEIVFEADSTPGIGTDMPGRIILSTSADGSSSPTERLRIAADGRSTFTSANAASMILSRNGAATFVIQDSGEAVGQKNWGIRSDQGNLYFGTLDDSYTSWTEKVTVLSSGNVGIGTASPGTIRLNTTTSIQGHWAAFFANTNAVEGHGVEINAGVDSGDTAFKIANYNGSTELFRVKADGRISTGGIAASSLLTLKSTADDSTGGIRIVDKDTTNVSVTMYAANDAGQIGLKSGGNSIINLDAGGDSYFNGGSVGIGTASPERELHIYSADWAEVRLDGSSGGAFEVYDGATKKGDIYIDSLKNMVFRNDSESMRIDPSQRFLLGHTASVAVGTISSKIQVSATGNTAGLTIARYQANDGPPALWFAKSRDASLGGQTIVQDNDEVGVIHFTASDGVDFNNSVAKILVKVDDATPAVDDIGGDIAFFTHPGGGGSLIERLRIAADGIVSVLNSGHFVLPQVNDAVTPTLAFGDGDTGLFEGSDDSLYVSIAGSGAWGFSSTYFQTYSGSGGGLLNGAPSSTVPSVLPFGSTDPNTGIGSAAADQLSLIAGGVELLRCTEAATDYVRMVKAYEDQQINIGNTRFIGSSDPTWTAYKNSEVIAFSASQDNEVAFTMQLSHKYMEGEDIEFHIHTVHPDSNTGNSKWTLTYSWANIGSDFPAESTASVTFASPADADKHETHDLIASISGTGKEVSSILLCNLTREGTDVADTYASDIYLVAMDAHIPVDAIGSDEENSKTY